MTSQLCSFCDGKAAFACNCGNFACEQHTYSLKCKKCYEAERSRREAIDAREALHRRKERWCDFCELSFAYKTTICKKCERHFCKQHGQSLTYYMIVNRGFRYHFERCEDHLFDNTLRGNHGIEYGLIKAIFSRLEKQADYETSYGP